MKEEWKDIESYKGLYQVSNLGRIRSLSTECYRKNEKILKPQLQNNGYTHIRLCKNGKGKTLSIHRLVAEAFLPNPNNYDQVNHKDENKQNNCVENLEWCNRTYNINYGNGIRKRVKTNIENGTYKKIGLINREKLSKSILQFSINGEFIKKWDCIKDIERELGFSHKTICGCLKNRQKTSHNYIWKYESDYELIPFKVFDLKIYRKKVA